MAPVVRLAAVAAVLAATACSGTPVSGPGPLPTTTITTSPTTPATPPPPAPPPRAATVVYVSDGDTIGVRVRGGDAVRPVRLLGIDTPETKDPGAVVQCGGRQASRALTKLLPRGSAVRLVRDPTQDPVDTYDRLLRYVEVGSRDVGRLLVARGLARVYVYDRPAFSRYPDYEQLEKAARNHLRASWRRCPTFGY